MASFTFQLWGTQLSQKIKRLGFYEKLVDRLQELGVRASVLPAINHPMTVTSPDRRHVVTPENAKLMDGHFNAIMQTVHPGAPHVTVISHIIDHSMFAYATVLPD
jgi:hypothetical protein